MDREDGVLEIAPLRIMPSTSSPGSQRLPPFAPKSVQEGLPPSMTSVSVDTDIPLHACESRSVAVTVRCQDQMPCASGVYAGQRLSPEPKSDPGHYQGSGVAALHAAYDPACGVVYLQRARPCDQRLEWVITSA
jgi:hypothetical protein